MARFYYLPNNMAQGRAFAIWPQLFAVRSEKNC